jgi:phospholipase/carboxylesterase
MKSQEQLIECVEITPNGTAKHCIIWLHGLGADGHDFVPIIPNLELPASLATRFIFPHAPIMPVTINNGYKMRAWFDIYEMSFTAKIDEKGILASKTSLERLIQQQIDLGVPSEHIILAGFSQGGAIALTTGLTYSKRLGGIIALSTYLPLPDKILANVNPANKTLPIYIAHGTQDNVLPYFLGESTAKLLEEAGHPVEWHSYNMPHSVCAEEIVDIGNWIKNRWN